MPMPPARNTAGRAASSCSTISPLGPSIVTATPSGAVFNTRLNAVSRMRVASINSASWGALAIVNVRESPSLSVSGGSTSVIRTDCPA
ncbi:hypothetical protein D3C83_29090 [compost metagenome]